MTGPFADLAENEIAELRQAAFPDWQAPMLATLTDKRFSDSGWLYERKLDGERALAFKKDTDVRLMSRNRKDISTNYPEILDALRRQPATDFIVDGEIVAFDGPVTSFSRLQKRMQISDPDRARQSGIAVHFYLFDILYLDGHDVTSIALRRRKTLLKSRIDFVRPLRFTPHRNRNGEAYYTQACKKGWEGVIAKRAASTYSHKRSTDWLKFKCAKGQELVIGGFTEPSGSRLGFGALLVGYHDGDDLRYAGRVGTGYDDAFLKDFRSRLDEISRDTSPFSDNIAENGVTWVEPVHVGEFEFTEWTRSGKLRHPRFLGLRRDKEAKDVIREGADGS